MKLVEINDVRVGQVWKNKKEMITIDSFYDDEEIQISAYNLSGKEIDMDYDDAHLKRFTDELLVHSKVESVYHQRVIQAVRAIR